MRTSEIGKRKIARDCRLQTHRECREERGCGSGEVEDRAPERNTKAAAKLWVAEIILYEAFAQGSVATHDAKRKPAEPANATTEGSGHGLSRVMAQ